MADYTMYHALGQGSAPNEGPWNQQNQQFNPSAGQPPAGSPYGNAPQPPYAAAQPSNVAPNPDAGYNAGSPGMPVEPGEDAIAGLTSQMGGMGISADGGARGQKKKSRHAYHDIGGAGSAPASSGMPHSGIQNPSSQFLNTGLNQQPQSVSPAGVQAPQGGLQQGFSGPGTGSVQTQGKVDPEQIPSIPRSRDIPTQYFMKHVYPTMERLVPPPAAIPFVAHDQGNSSPKFARLTLNNIPSTSEFLSSTSLPLGMILQPLARLDPGEQPIPVLDFGDAGPPRCRRCRAYINPFMTFKAGGNKFVCNMCTFPNDVPPEYYAPLDHSGVRVDRLQRPELMMGTVEFLVPKEYWSKEPVGLRWLFLIDVSQESVNRGFLEGVCEGIMGALYGGDNETSQDGDETTLRRLPPGSKVGIMTFDKEVHFYNLSVSVTEILKCSEHALLTIV